MGREHTKEMALSVMCLPHKCEDLGTDPQLPCQNQTSQVWYYLLVHPRDVEAETDGP